jgi:hypothetical protein
MIMAVGMILFVSIAVASAPSRLTVELATPRTVYLVGEPVVLDITLRNDTARPVEASRTVLDREILVRVAGGGHAFRPTGPPPPHAKVERRWEILKPDESWTYRVLVPPNFIYRGRAGEAPSLPHLPRPGPYLFMATFPVIQRDYGELIPSSCSVTVEIQAPSGDDVKVFESINDEKVRAYLASDRIGDEAIVSEVARTLERHPKTAYRDSLVRPLEKTWKVFKDRDPEDPNREVVRRALGKPDDRLFPDDPRLEKEIVLNIQAKTPVRDIFDLLGKQAGVSLSGSPYFTRGAMKWGGSGPEWTRTLRFSMRLLLRMFGPEQDLKKSAWVRRGDGYYLYCEVLNAGPETRRQYNELLGPVEALFPDDKRLDVEVVADFPEPTPIDRVLAAYAEQTGIPLSASPFLNRCRQSGAKMTLNLRAEMAYLARTFRVSWERQGDGYYLNAGKDADEERVPPRP